MLTEGIIAPKEQKDFLELVQQLPKLAPEDLMKLNLIASPGYLIENTAPGIF
jgi:hypothetical protein